MSASDAMLPVLQGMAEVLAKTKVKVPSNQRTYAWESEQVTDLFSDLEKAMTSSAEVYYLGTITLRNVGADYHEIVDGQQRLTTISVLMGAIRDYFHSNGDPEKAGRFYRDYLGSENWKSGDMQPNITLHSLDNEFFEKAILSLPGSPQRSIKPEKQSHERLLEAARIAREHVERIAARAAEPSAALETWMDYLTKNATTLVFHVPKKLNPYTVFETLNGRGLQLCFTDNLKNYLFGTAGDDGLQEVQSSWAEMIGALDACDIGRDKVLEDYIRYLWSASHGVTRVDVLFRQIRQEISSKSLAKVFARRLAEGAKSYRLILNPSSTDWSKYGSAAVDYMMALNVLGMKQIHPLILSILAKFDDCEVGPAMSLMLATAVRFLIAGKSGSGLLETHYSAAAVEVMKGRITNRDGLAGQLRSAVPNDTTFRQQFQAAQITKAQQARYLLRVLEMYESGKRQPELVPNTDTSVVNLEHILPKKPCADWISFTPEEVVSYRYRLANQLLLRSKLNRRVGSSSFAVKKTHYSVSSMLLTQEVATLPVWGPKEIEDRQSRLAALAIRAWPFK